MRLEDLLERPDWQRDALCAEPAYVDLNWFPTKGANGVPESCRQVCARCLVRDECRRYVIATGEKHGIWAGEFAATIQKRQVTSRGKRAA